MNSKAVTCEFAINSISCENGCERTDGFPLLLGAGDSTRYDRKLRQSSLQRLFVLSLPRQHQTQR